MPILRSNSTKGVGMTTIDHAAEARVLEANAWARGGIDGDTLIRRPEERRDIIASAQVHATLALVEQQRIANLIALSQATNPDESRVSPGALTHPVNEYSVAINDDIKKGLGL